MSAFLGPIHYWVFRKVRFQNEMVNRLIALAKANGIDLEPELLQRFGDLEQQPLEEIIDGSNIHGWLQERVSLVESRLAYAVTSILKAPTLTMSDLEALFYDIGKANKPTNAETATDVFAYLNDTLLDGMPCDRVNETISESAEAVTWRRNGCVHGQYWDALGGDVRNYYALRDALVRGMLDGTGYQYTGAESGVYSLSRR